MRRKNFLLMTLLSISLFVKAQKGKDQILNDSISHSVLNKKVLDSTRIRTDTIAVDVDFDDYMEDQEQSNTIAGLLSASMDVITRTMSYDFSPAFYRNRMMDSDRRTVMLNHVVMNKYYNGRADWNNWGGLNDALRNQEIHLNLSASSFSTGDLGGIVNINSQASAYPEGVKVSLAGSNKTYSSRLMASYGSGWIKDKWKYNISASTRQALEGYREGSVYEAYSFLASIDWRFSTQHSLNATAIMAYTNRGLAAPMTNEVFELKGRRYNAYWGLQENRIRNSRMRMNVEPIFQLNYQFSKPNGLHLLAHLTFQKGKRSSSRLDYGGSSLVQEFGTIVGGGSNPDPSYYQKLPSYYLKDYTDPDYTGAYLARKKFLQDGQLNWEELYMANLNGGISERSIYALYADQTDDTLFSLKIDGQKQIGSAFWLRGSIEMRSLISDNYAKMIDLLGGNGYLDVDSFDQGEIKSQNDLRNPNRIVFENDTFRYNYRLVSNQYLGYLRGDYSTKKQEFYLACDYGRRTYQRTGLFENGSFPGNASYGKGKLVGFDSFRIKMNLVHKFNGRHLIDFQTAYIQRPPHIKDSYSNIRENNDLVRGLKGSETRAFDLTYRIRLPRIQARIGAYWMETNDQTRVSFYYADGLTGLENSGTSAFVQEVVQGIDTELTGLEVGGRFKVTDGISIKGVATLGYAFYSDNPSVYITSDELTQPVFYGRSSLKGYRVPNGPQQAFSFGFEYSDPNYWWVGMSYNWFDHSYIQIAPVIRTKNFFLDSDGFEIQNFDLDTARLLLEQERFKPFALMNLVGGKSWKVNKMIFGVFVSINNLLDQTFITGGFEQSRNANYEKLLEDKLRETPLFGPKYWYGYGSTIYASIYLRTL